ncbi:MAG TPA: NAD-dependent epimerase/dehydratase family protein [Candidatus Lustribacter sp.]|nr:NAD-dependent epimerase/dehydratase family protein [Candidatus Lustribacter sp.]
MSSPTTARPAGGRGRAVAVAGAASSVPGQIVSALTARALRRGGPVSTVIGVDTVRGRAGSVQWRLADLRSPALASVLAGVDTVVWVACSTDLQRDLERRASERRAEVTRTALTVSMAAAAAGVSHLVVVTSAMVYGAAPDNPLPITEDSTRRATSDEGLVGDLLAVEDVLERSRPDHPGLAITLVRPAALVGAGVDTVVTRHFAAPRLLAVKGTTPAWQFCHVEDLASGVAETVARGLGPVVTVGSVGSMTQAEVERLSGMRRVELSESAALGTAARLHRIGVLPSPASDLSYALYPWVVSSETLRANAWEPAYDNATALGVLLDGVRGQYAIAGRRVERKDAALGAASAAVALVGTAAILRRARRK